MIDASASASELQGVADTRPFSRDPLWWSVCIAAVMLSAIARLLHSGDRSGLLSHAVGVPLVTAVAIIAYRRVRLRKSWLDSVWVGLACAAITLAISWLSERLL